MPRLFVFLAAAFASALFLLPAADCRAAAAEGYRLDKQSPRYEVPAQRAWI